MVQWFIFTAEQVPQQKSSIENFFGDGTQECVPYRLPLGEAVTNNVSD